MKAVILVGGPGTRLQPLTDTVPKSMVPVLTVPVMEHTLAYLRQYGIDDVILTLNYLPDIIRDSLGDGSQYGVRLTYCMEEDPLGTAGAVKNTADFLDGEAFLVLNGDVFTDLDLGDMIEFHRKNNAKATISLNWVEDPSAFGVVEMDENSRVKAFIEKPPREEATTNWINAGTYVLEPDILKKIPDGSHYMFENGLYPSMLAAGDPVYGYRHSGYWLDMGTLGKYYSLNVDMLEERYRSPAVGTSISIPLDVDKDPSARFSGEILIDHGVSIGKNVTITGPTVIGGGTCIEDNACIEASIIWDGVTIGSGARLRECVISRNVVINSGADILHQVVTPDKTATLNI